MINRNKQSAKPGARGAKNKNTGLDFFNTDLLSFSKEPAKILGARVQDDGWKAGKQLVAVKILFKTNTYLWNLRDNNPNLDILCDALGEDETKWSNVDIAVFNEKDDFDNKIWMRCEVLGGARKK